MNSILRNVATAALSCAALLTPLAASAVPAYPGLIKMTQPDGSEISVQLRGDENHHITLTEDGYLLTQTDGAFYYADVDNQGRVVSSRFMAKPKSMRTQAECDYLAGIDMDKVLEVCEEHRDAVLATKTTLSRAMSPSRVAPLATNEKGYGLFAGATYPVTGKQKGLVILVEYDDVKFNTSYDAHDYFHRMLNEKDFSTNGGTGSARDYFLEVSDGQFDIEFDLYGPVTLPEKRSYYGQNNNYGSDVNAWRMAVDACELLDDEVDFTQYDRDGDGRIDNVFLFYAGMGEATGGGADCVWPHAFYVTTMGTHKVDGVIIDRYACTNEWETIYKGGGRPDGVGTFIHEFSHVMGLPDLYSTAYNSLSFTPGSWSCMDLGPYNNEGRTPPLYGMFERNALGWAKPTPITGPMNARLEQIGTNQGYIINTARPQEFFLLENRQQVSWDRYIPANGMLIWHILYNASIWTQNAVNNTPAIQYVDIEEADGTQTEATRAYDVFPGPGGRYNEFTDETTPNMLTWQKKSVGLPLTDITMNSGIVSFKVAGGRAEVNSTEALESKDITPGGFTAVWKAVEGDMKYAISVYTKNAQKPAYVSGLYKRLVEGTSYVVSDLEPSTTYYWTIAVYDPASDEYSDNSNELSFTTGEASLEYLRPELKETTEVTDNAFTINWEAFEGATNYYVNLFTRKAVDLGTETCGFDEFVRPTYYLPAGWATNVSGNYTNANYAGESAPSIKMTSDGDYVQTPVLKGSSTVRSLKFWHRGVTANDENTIRVEALVGDSWQEVTELAISYAITGQTLNVQSFPDLTQSVRIVFNRQVTGSLAIDDIVVSYASGDEDVAVAAYTDCEVAAPTTSLTVTGLNPNTYCYTVTAEVGGVRTRPSFAGKIVLGSPDTAIDDIAADVALSGVTLEGNRITVTEAATVYDLQGRVLAEMNAGASRTLPTGVYMVRTAGVTAKVVLR